MKENKLIKSKIGSGSVIKKRLDILRIAQGREETGRRGKCGWMCKGCGGEEEIISSIRR